MTTEQKFTPGPWTAHWSKYREGCYVVQTSAPSNRILAKFDGDGDGPDEQEIASAHLIAAAPDMLAALKAIRAHRPDHADNVWDAVDEAISKAERVS